MHAFRAVFAVLFFTLAAQAAVPAHYLVLNVSRSGEVTLYSRSEVVLDAEPQPDEAQTDGLVPNDRERIVVEAGDRGGRARFRRVIDVDRIVRSEWVDPLTGEMRSRIVELDQAPFVVRVPSSAGESIVATHARSGRSTRIEIASRRVEAPIGNAILTPVVNSGSPSNRLDVLIMGDGYTSAQQSKFTTDAANLTATFFNMTPYSDYQNYLNTATLFTASAQSGADHPVCSDPSKNPDPLEGTSVSTAFDATYCAFNIQRLLTVDTNKVYTAAAASPNWDKIFVLVNDTMYGGSGGALLVGSLNGFSTNIVQHEFGHSFSGLADEYTSPYPGFPACSDISGSSPCEANVTNQTIRNSIKWAPWIAPSTLIPTPDSDTTDIGLFTGARYQSSGMYRPKQDCLMNHLGVAFCAICRQTFILKLYGGWGGTPANGIDMIEPGTESPSTAATVQATVGTPTPFSFTLLQPAGGPAASIQWSVDGGAVGGANGTTFQYTPASAGAHTVSLTVHDPTSAVNATMAGTTLTKTRSWSVNATNPTLAAPASITANATSSSVSISWPPVAGATSYELARSTNGAGWTTITMSATSYNDAAVASNNAYLYKVRALASGSSSLYSPIDLATVFTATDDPLPLHAKVKAAHLTEVRAAIDLARHAAGLSAASYTRTISGGLTILANDVLEMRAAIDAARSALGMSAYPFSDALTPHVTAIRKVHVDDLRTAIR